MKDHGRHLTYELPGHRWIYEYEERTSQGERLVVEMTLCDNPGGNNSIPRLWHQRGLTEEELATYWAAQTYAYGEEGDCFGRYNPTLAGAHRIDFDWVLEGTEENREALLREVERRAFEE